MAMSASVIERGSSPTGLMRSTTAVAEKQGAPLLSNVSSRTSVSRGHACSVRSTNRRLRISG